MIRLPTTIPVFCPIFNIFDCIASPRVSSITVTQNSFYVTHFPRLALWGTHSVYNIPQKKLIKFCPYNFSCRTCGGTTNGSPHTSRQVCWTATEGAFSGPSNKKGNEKENRSSSLLRCTFMRCCVSYILLFLSSRIFLRLKEASSDVYCTAHVSLNTPSPVTAFSFFVNTGESLVFSIWIPDWHIVFLCAGTW